ncbi:hypothetical protein K8T06_13165 [bacterium]|nr:hypothetical protein [bacterium]
MKSIFGLEMGVESFSTTLDHPECQEPVRLRYPDSVKNKFLALIGILSVFTVVLPWLHILDVGWVQIFGILDFMLVLFYRYRLRRIIEVSEQGVCELLGKKEWRWTWSEIEEVRHTSVTLAGSIPAHRMVVEHKSTHDITFDDQMSNYDDAVTLIRRFWHNGTSRKIELNSVPFILMKYW